ncbi:peptidase inhibitor family I36 protein [Actinocorallia libanotica]|uniref:Peptidase inhibitor family I36 n=1 Tax=Actinocorallia libanotica TaxID=46162 RepID=A0ABN1R8Q2_9ACTN
MLVHLRLTSIVLATAAAFLTAPPAGAVAAAGWDNCPVNHFCVWDGLDGTGRVAHYTNGSNNVTGQGLRGLGKSGWNRTQSSWCTWKGTGEQTAVGANQRVNLDIRGLRRPHTWACPI